MRMQRWNVSGDDGDDGGRHRSGGFGVALLVASGIVLVDAQGRARAREQARPSSVRLGLLASAHCLRSADLVRDAQTWGVLHRRIENHTSGDRRWSEGWCGKGLMRWCFAD